MDSTWETVSVRMRLHTLNSCVFVWRNFVGFLEEREKRRIRIQKFSSVLFMHKMLFIGPKLVNGVVSAVCACACDKSAENNSDLALDFFLGLSFSQVCRVCVIAKWWKETGDIMLIAYIWAFSYCFDMHSDTHTHRAESKKLFRFDFSLCVSGFFYIFFCFSFLKT